MLAAQPRIGELLRALGLVDRTAAFESLHLDALFREAKIEPGDAAPLSIVLRRPLVHADPAIPATIVSWFGARDPGFVARLTALVPGAIVAPSSEAGRLVWRHLLATVSAPLEHADRWCAPVPLPARLTDEGRRVLLDAGWDGATPLVVVHPGAGGAGKRWPAEGFAAVLEGLAARGGITLAVHRGPADAEAVAALGARLGGPTIVLQEPSLPALAGLLGCAAAYLGNDSGVSHLAAALGVPSVVLFTADKLDWQPWARRVEVLTVRTSAVDAADGGRVSAAIRAVMR